jgi:hypothetical protein
LVSRPFLFFDLTGIHGQAAFNGKYFMFIYFAVCLLTYAYFLINSARLNQTKL